MSKLTRGKTKEIEQSPKQTMIKADIVEKVKIFMPLIKYLSRGVARGGGGQILSLTLLLVPRIPKAIYTSAVYVITFS